ncbi:efflux RND transporter permease subunit [Oceanicoccus sagamiensis]|uniref:RND transporter n=1 Tax=Oceanicoccus sagamiensis TaxID=716816 RepID=A0A1X9NCX8_9GAMM|nr:efflux RND transporter permease subunit [Oceanicoccus sagamiensis]ARN75011.1 RND transporter [Oceanicoccus sagamiensis]
MKAEGHGLIGWFANNPVAANLLMLLIVVAGLLSAQSISKEMFPQAETGNIQITASYPGAAPIEVETGVILPIEAALQGEKGIKQIRSTASRDMGSVVLELESDEDLNEVLGRVKNRIDGIVNFPEHLEKPTINKEEVFRFVLSVNVAGSLERKALKRLGQQVHDELLALPEIKRLMLWGVENDEVAIEVHEQQLREFDLTLNEVASILRASSFDLPAGMIRAREGHIMVRTQGKAYTAEDFSALVLRSHSDGTELRLSDVATVRDTLVETNGQVRFDQQSAVSIGVFALQGQSLLAIDQAVVRYVDNKRSNLPEGVSLDTNFQTAFYLQGRLDMMLNNLAVGALLVMIVLSLFLNLSVAGWVMLGIPVSFLGALWLMPVNPFPVNITIPSLFAFILVLGIVVDDAIVIGESIYAQTRRQAANKPELRASVDTVIRGTRKVAAPATIGVLTTVAAFVPMLFVGGTMAPMLESIAVVVILCLLFSLIESKLILPAHLVGMSTKINTSPRFSWLNSCQRGTQVLLGKLIERGYRPLLSKAIVYRYTALAAFLACLLIAINAVRSGLVAYEFFPNVPGDMVMADIVMQEGASRDRREQVLQAVEQAAYRVSERHQQQYPQEPVLLEHLLLYSLDDNSVRFNASLNRSELRSVNAPEFEKLWREAMGPQVGVRQQRYYSTSNAWGAKINLSLSGADTSELTAAGRELQNKLAEYKGVYDIYNSQGIGGREVQISLKPHAQQMGIQLADVARQVRQAFYGEEVQRLQRGPDTVKVMVRYPLDERRSLASLERMQIRAADGRAVDIREVANLHLGNTVSAISRLDRKRTVTITADVDSELAQSGKVINEITTEFIPQLLKRYPSVSFGLGGASLEQQTLMKRMIIGFIASLFFIYSLLAIPLRSYVQPLIIMAAIPFGFIGALIGHSLFGVSFSLMSLFGLVALAGVVVNDSLILVEFTNRARAKGDSVEAALVKAGTQRFRAIVLTTLTTFAGLLPILFERSLQAQFVIPMALSLGFGIVFATAITLVLVPCLYRSIDDLPKFSRGKVVRPMDGVPD